MKPKQLFRFVYCYSFNTTRTTRENTIHKYIYILLITYVFTPLSRVILQKLRGFQLLKKFPTFYGTRKIITVFTSACQLSLTSASSIQSIPPHPTSWRYVLILSSHPCLGLSSGLFPSGFPIKTLYTALLSRIRAKCPAHVILLDFVTRKILGDEYWSLNSSLCSFLHYLVTSFHLHLIASKIYVKHFSKGKCGNSLSRSFNQGSDHWNSCNTLIKCALRFNSSQRCTKSERAVTLNYMYMELHFILARHLPQVIASTNPTRISVVLWRWVRRSWFSRIWRCSGKWSPATLWG